MAGGMQRVELDDDGAAEPPRTPDGPPPARTRRVPRRVVVAGAAVVVAALALVGTQQVLDGRRHAADGALAARYADVPGVVEPFGPDLRLAWQTDTATGSAVRDGATAGDVVVGLDRVGAADIEVVGVDPRDGSRRWSTPVELAEPRQDERPYWIDASVDPTDVQRVVADMANGISDAWCVPTGDDRGLVVCGAQRGVLGAPTPMSASVWLVDPVDGTVPRTLSTGVGAWVRPLDDVLVVVRGATADGVPAGDAPPSRWSVEGLDPVTWEPRWTWTSPALDDDVPIPQVTWSEPSRGHVLVGSGASAWVVDADGALVDETAVAVAVGLVLDRDGRARPPSVRTTGTDGLLRNETTASVGVDDGSLPDLTFALRTGFDDGGLVARSADGTERWAVDEVRLPLAVLDDRVLVRTFDGLALLDGSDGARVWSTRTGVDGDVVVTDGRTVLVRVGDRLRAVSLASGRTAWERDLAALGVAGEVVEWGAAPGLRRVLLQMRDGAVVTLG